MENNRKKALIVASVASMIDLFNRENISILRDLGYDIEVAANFDNGSITDQNRVNAFEGELKADGIKVFNVRIPRKISDIGNIIKSYRALKKIVDAGRYDLVHCQSPIGGVLCRKACKRARKEGTKVVYEAHGFHFFKGASKVAWILYYPIEKHYSRYTDVLLTMNSEDFGNAGSMKAGKVVNISGIGIHTNEISSRKPDREALRRELGFGKDDFILLSVGQLSKRKNHEVVIEALAKIPDKRIKYLIVGFGELEADLKQRAGKMQLEDRVVFSGFRNDVWDIVHVADGFVFPSRQEGLPVSLMEAMTAGLPVVCSRIRGNVDLIEDGKGGFLCGYDNADQFADRLRQISDDSPDGMELRKKMGTVNMETMNRFDVSVVRKQLEEVYREVTAEKGE